MSQLSLFKKAKDEEIASFLRKTSSSLHIVHETEKVIKDISWIDVIEEAIPYLDSIIRHPRRFIVQESDVIPVEKTKKISQETIIHLAQHTNYIQDVEDDGFVRPSKLLNVRKEETIDLYENRFIYSLIKKLWTFIFKQLEYMDVKSHISYLKSVDFKGTTKYNDENIKMNLSLETKKHENLEESNNEHTVEERILYLQEVVSDFMKTPFMKEMNGALLVYSPIRKTNVILKEANFKKALELWEYLTSIEGTDLITVQKSSWIDNNLTKKDGFDLTYYLNYFTLNYSGDNKKEKVKWDNYLQKVLEDYLEEHDLSEKELKKTLEGEIKKVYQYKYKIQEDIANIYLNFIKEKENNIKKEIKEFLK